LLNYAAFIIILFFEGGLGILGGIWFSCPDGGLFIFIGLRIGNPLLTLLSSVLGGLYDELVLIFVLKSLIEGPILGLI